MSLDEAAAWQTYILKRGTLNVGLRNEAMLARVILSLCHIGKIKKQTGGEFTFMDFAPHLRTGIEDDDEDGDEEGISFEHAVHAFKGIGHK